MSDREDHQDKIRKLLKSQPLLTPPESFYEGVRRRIESNKAAPRGFWLGVPLKVFASACVLMLVVWVAKDKEPSPQRRSEAMRHFAPRVTAKAGVAGPVMSEEMKKTADAASLDEVRGEPTLKDMNLKEAPAQRRKSPSDDEQLRQLAQNAPAPTPLNKRADVHMQARDMEGAAAQNSFGYTDQLKAKQKNESAYTIERDASPALQSKSLAGGRAFDVPMYPASTAAGGKLDAAKESVPTARLNLDAGWVKCTQDAECTLVPEPGECLCACSVAINKKHEADYQKLHTEFCRQNPSKLPCNKICADTRPVCAAGTCDLLIKN